jgi:hypothetical protein
MNGGVTITPTKRQTTVEIYHRLSTVRERLGELQQAFDKADRCDPENLVKLRDKNMQIRDDYVKILRLCSDGARAASVDAKNDRLYEVLYLFLKRTAANDHTILPHIDYFNWYFLLAERFVKQGNKDFQVDALGNADNLWNVTKLRLKDGIDACEGYLCMLASSMDTSLKKVNIGEIAASIVETCRQVSLVKSMEVAPYEMYNQEFFSELQAAHQNVKVLDNYKGTVTNFAPLLNIIFTCTTTNAFKASFIASAQQKYDADNFLNPMNRGFNSKVNQEFLKKYERKVPQIDRPEISVLISEKDKNTVSVAFTDNGIGIPKEDLHNLFAFQSTICIFSNYTCSSGSTMQLIPHLLDFTGITLHANSAIGKGASFEYLIPKEIIW